MLEAQRAEIEEYGNWTGTLEFESLLPGIEQNLAHKLIMALGLGGELEEIMEELTNVRIGVAGAEELLFKELGDVMFCWARICIAFDFDIGDMYTKGRLGISQPYSIDSLIAGVMRSTGQVQEALKKLIRDGELNRSKLEAALIGYAANWKALCAMIGHYSHDVLLANRHKLNDRFARGTLRGSGNER